MGGSKYTEVAISETDCVRRVEVEAGWLVECSKLRVAVEQKK
jgi:hypothetical protein